MDVTDRHLSLNSLMKMDETVLHPRNYDGAVFEMISSTHNLAFRQNAIHGGQPIAIFSASAKACKLFGDCSIPYIHTYRSHPSIINFTYLY